jgi:Putative zinc-finger
MTIQTNIANDHHDDVWELLPWYINEGLSDDEVSQVEAHLKDCPACQSEAARCRDINHTVKANQSEDWTPSAGHFATVLASVEAYEVRRAKGKTGEHWLTKWFAWFTDTPRPARFALGLQGALVVALATTLLLRGVTPTEGYRTLSQPNVHPQTNSQQIHLVFNDDITERELREMLLGVRGHIVAGPTPLGVYSIAVESSSGSPDTLAKLRAHPKVRLAEAIHTTGE